MIIFVLVDLVSWSSNKQIFVTTRSLTINYGVDNHMKFVCAISQQREEGLARRTAKCTTYRNSWPQKLSPQTNSVVSSGNRPRNEETEAYTKQPSLGQGLPHPVSSFHASAFQFPFLTLQFPGRAYRQTWTRQN